MLLASCALAWSIAFVPGASAQPADSAWAMAVRYLNTFQVKVPVTYRPPYVSMRDCTEASWAKTLAGVEGSYYGGTAESFILVRQMRRCGWDKGPQARAIYDAYERSGDRYMFQWGMIGFVTGEISREEYIEFGKTYMRRASEKLDGPLNWAVVTVAVEMAARTCVIDPRKTCTSEVLRNMLPVGLKVDLVSELAWGDLLGLPSEHLQGDQEAVERSVEFTAGSSFPIRKDLIAAVDASKRPKLLGTRREWLRSHYDINELD